MGQNILHMNENPDTVTNKLASMAQEGLVVDKIVQWGVDSGQVDIYWHRPSDLIIEAVQYDNNHQEVVYETPLPTDGQMNTDSYENKGEFLKNTFTDPRSKALVLISIAILAYIFLFGKKG